MNRQVKITIKNLQKKIPINPKGIKKKILEVLSCEKIKKSGEITVCYVNDNTIKRINKEFLGKKEPTDVLAFDMLESADPRHMFADIIISTDTALRNANIFATSPKQELNLYIVHGLLHLLGFDDHSPKQKKLMRKKEEEYAYT